MVSSIKEKKKKVSSDLKQIGQSMYHHLTEGTFPWVELPSRSTSNILYSKEHNQYILGDRKSRRTSSNIRQIRSLTQLVWAAYFVKELAKQGKTSTLRDVYYSAQAFEMSFKDQPESDNILTDIEALIGHPREAFNVFPEERSAIFGDLTIEYTVPGYEGRQLNLTGHPDGVMIGPALTNAELVECKADKVIAIEKGALFTRFIEERVHEKFNAILIQTAGQAPRATRGLLRRLNSTFNLPIIVLTDGDPWGMHIAMVIISGSANAAHIRELNTPNAQWMGVWATDIIDYKLPTDPLSDLDIKRLHELDRDPRYKEALWKREIKTFLKIKKKAEQEAFSRYGLTFIVDEYLPAKIEEFDKSKSS